MGQSLESSARQQMISHDNIDIEKNKNDTIHYDDDINDGCKVIIMRTVIITIMEVMKFVIMMINNDGCDRDSNNNRNCDISSNKNDNYNVF